MRQCLQFVTIFSTLRIIDTLYFAEPTKITANQAHVYNMTFNQTYYILII